MNPGDPQPDKPLSFGYKCAWFAVRSNDTAAVAAACGLEDPRPCSWSSGTSEIYELDQVFVTPALGEWVLVAGCALFYPDATPEESVLPLLTQLSAQFGEAQYFCTHRVVEAHCWAVAHRGRLIRAFAYVGDRGEVTWDFGHPTITELELGSEVLEFPGPCESQVMAVAGAWSINPAELETQFTELGTGLLASFE